MYIGCQATQRALRNIDYMRTLSLNLFVISYHECIIVRVGYDVDKISKFDQNIECSGKH